MERGLIWQPQRHYAGFDCGVPADSHNSVRKSMDYCRQIWDEA